MLTEIKLEYFKSFVEKTISLNNLTVLTGLNSSGKSSIIQAIRIMKKVEDKEKNILLAGHGTFDEIINNASKDRGTIGLEIIDNDSNIFKLKIEKNKFKSNNTEKVKFPEIIYIAADRFGPQATIPLINNFSEEHIIGSHGENLLQFIEKNKDQILDEKLKHELSEGETLIYNLKAWLNEISPNIKFDYNINQQSDTSFSLFNEHRATNVGFGLSYTLPVIVALLAGTFIKNSIVLIENPEAHLHPRGQTAIARLIALCVSAGAQIIIETHSDHIFDGIRIEVKKGIIEPEKVQIHWFELDEKNNTEVYSPIIDKNGRLNEWPAGMFDQFETNAFQLL